MANKQRLGQLLIQQELVSQDTIDQALHIQVGRNHRLGYILVRMKAITADQLVETLAIQLDIPICDIASRFSPAVRGMMPRYLCRQYGVLPLTLKSNNILEVAMANPADEEAQNDVENTGKVVEPCMARQSDIDREITKCIPFGLKDLFSPRTNTRLIATDVVVCLALVLLLDGFTYRYIQDTIYGTISVSADSTLYKNHNLMLAFENNGKTNLLGRGTFAKGDYSVSFDDSEVMYAFLNSRQAELSDKQKSWLDWVSTKEQSRHPANH